MANLQTIVFCEEKYTDEFRTDTQLQRKITDGNLKTALSIENDDILNKDAVTKTSQGNMAVSNYIAYIVSYVHKLQIENNFKLIILSEVHKKAYNCQPSCQCPDYCTTIACYYEENVSRIE